MCDVPCSGLGIIRKKPDIRLKREEELKQLPQVQFSILANAARYVKPGGTLVYSTCTVLPEENERVVDRFLRTEPAFDRKPFVLPAPIGAAADGQSHCGPSAREQTVFISVHCAENDP